MQTIRQRLLENNIELERDHHVADWIEFRDPDHNKIGVVMERTIIEFEVPEAVIYDTIRFYIESKEDAHFIIRQISDQSEFESASKALIKHKIILFIQYTNRNLKI